MCDEGKRELAPPFGTYSPKTVELRLHSERIKHRPAFNARLPAKLWLSAVYLWPVAEAFSRLFIRHAERHKARQVANRFPAQRIDYRLVDKLSKATVALSDPPAPLLL